MNVLTVLVPASYFRMEEVAPLATYTLPSGPTASERGSPSPSAAEMSSATGAPVCPSKATTFFEYHPATMRLPLGANASSAGAETPPAVGVNSPTNAPGWETYAVKVSPPTTAEAETLRMMDVP